jgi:hypothetical protein
LIAASAKRNPCCIAAQKWNSFVNSVGKALKKRRFQPPSYIVKDGKGDSFPVNGFLTKLSSFKHLA